MCLPSKVYEYNYAGIRQVRACKLQGQQKNKNKISTVVEIIAAVYYMMYMHVCCLYTYIIYIMCMDNNNNNNNMVMIMVMLEMERGVFSHQPCNGLGHRVILFFFY